MTPTLPVCPTPLAAAVTLPYSPERYFNISPGTRLIPLDLIDPLRARPEGIAHAERFMRAAYDGKGSKRAPIALLPKGDGRYTIHDGNSTYANAVKHGWPDIPATLVAQV